MKWVSVEDRLPDKDGKYKIKGIKGSISPKKFETKALFKYGKKGGYFLYGFDWCKITHWKPLTRHQASNNRT